MTISSVNGVDVFVKMYVVSFQMSYILSCLIALARISSLIKKKQ